MIDLYALKFVADPIRWEPRNIGVIAVEAKRDTGPHAVASRVIGQREDGSMGRTVKGVPKEVLAGWVEYYVRQLASGETEGMERLRRSRPTRFFVERALTILDEEDPRDALERNYYDIVHSTRRAADQPRLEDRVDELLAAAHILPQQDYRFEAEYEGTRLPTEFAFAFQNGQLHLMDAVEISPVRATTRRNANDFAWRTSLARRAGQSKSFVCFVDLGTDLANDEDDEIRVLDRVAHVADVSRPDQAVDLLRSLAGH